MTFQDIFKSSFLENIASISLFDMALALVLAFLLAPLCWHIAVRNHHTKVALHEGWTPVILAMTISR